MSPLALAAIWLLAGTVATVVLPRLRHRRLAWLAPAIAAAATLAVTRETPWPGPDSSAAFGAALVLGRPAVGLLVIGGAALAASMALAPRLDGGEVGGTAVVGAAVVVALGATVPIIWSVALAVAMGTIAVRWIAAAPGRATIAAGRVAGLGAAALIAAATFLPVAGPAVDARTALAGGLLAGGMAALLGLVPLGGWVAAAAGSVRGVELAPWALLVGPALLLSGAVTIPGLPAGTQKPVLAVLLIGGLVSAVFGGLMGIVTTPAARYGRLLIADLALAAAGLGSSHSAGRLGGELIILTHLCAAPLMLHPERVDTVRPRRLTWLAVSGLPPSPAFWARLLVLESLAAVSGLCLVGGLLATAVLLGASIRPLLDPADPDPDLPGTGLAGQMLAWAMALAAIAVGLAPGALAERVFGPLAGAG